MVDADGIDVNLYDDWETSMMGLAAYDPLWRAKVSHEILTNPGHANELQTLCTSCHAPMGHFTAIYKGFQHYTLSDLYTDTLGLAGVACMGCHSLDSVNQGNVFTGNLTFDTSNVAYGPFENPMMGPMQLYVGLTPKFSTHLNRGDFCSPCHTLISNTVDLNGNPTGNTFVEQATFQEWKNSSFPAQQITCQTCHMPQIQDQVKIAVGYTALPGRTPFNLHQFSGANSFMVRMIKDNKNSLGITASDANFDSTLSAINSMLVQQTLTINSFVDTISTDTLFLDIELINKAGHKFPTGYPSRRAVLQVAAITQSGDTLFSSGIFKPDAEVMNLDSVYEKHYNIITDSTQIQIYEMLMADVNGNKTTLLERAATHIKDNRIPPGGFTSMHSSYDTCKIVGDAVSDPDFNKTGLVEGTGRDIVHYHIPLKGYLGQITIYSGVYYQSVPPGWLTEMSSMSSAEIDTFFQMYGNADKSPVLISADTIHNLVINTGISELPHTPMISVIPNPNSSGLLYIKTNGALLNSIKIYNLKGLEIKSFEIQDKLNTFEITLPPPPGIYLVQVNTTSGIFVEKVIKLN